MQNVVIWVLYQVASMGLFLWWYYRTHPESAKAMMQKWWRFFRRT